MTNITISNTQITAKNTCGKMHSYAYDYEIQPIEPKPWLYRGEIGHSALDAYYFEMKEGSPFSTCYKAAKDVITKEQIRVATETPDAYSKIDILSNLDLLIKEYAERYQEESFRVIAVEEEYRAPLLVGADFMLRLDLLVEFTSGEFRGDLAIIDHKFTYNFKSVVELELDAQLPKYVQTLRKNGFTISKAFFNQLRYRKDAKDKFKREQARGTTLIAREQIWKEQQSTAADILEEKNIPTEKKEIRRVLNPLVCKMCDYKDLCSAELNGTDITQMIAANYKKRERGFRFYDD